MEDTVFSDFFACNKPPSDFQESQKKMQDFCTYHEGGLMALVTSGGTTVPLEHNTVRFVDNFSGGNRGSASAEYFLEKGYNVIFLHRAKSLQPFSRHFNGTDLLDALTIKKDENGQDPTRIEVIADDVPKMLPILQKYKAAKEMNRLLIIEFTTLSDYLWLLREACARLKTHRHCALLYLAAAVSDFYVPADKMPKHKMQSGDGAPTISLNLVPKMMKPLVSEWVPDAFVVSFKLETDHELLLTKARAALDTYNHEVVIGNILNTRKYKVTMVGHCTDYHLELSRQERDANFEIEEKIVDDITRRHASYMKDIQNVVITLGVCENPVRA